MSQVAVVRTHYVVHGSMPLFEKRCSYEFSLLVYCSKALKLIKTPSVFNGSPLAITIC